MYYQMFAKPFLCFAFVSAFTSMVASEPFCEAFQRNGNKVSIVLREGKSSEADRRDRITNYHFIISGKYWTASFKRPKDGSNEKPTFNLNADIDKSSLPFYTDQYYIGVWMEFPGTEMCPFLFPRTNWKQLKVGIGGKVMEELANMKENHSLTIKGVDTQPMIAFSEYENVQDSTGGMRLVFISQSAPGSGFIVDRFDMKYDGKELMATKNINTTNLKAIRELKTNYELISVVPQWTEGWAQYDEGYSHVYLFHDNGILKWCVGLGKDQPNNMCKKRPELVIDCSINETTTESVPPPSTEVDNKEEKSSYVLIMIIVGIVVIVIILILIYIFCCRQRKTEDQAKPMSSVDHKSVRSGIKGSPKSEAGKKSSGTERSPPVQRSPASSSGQKK